MIQSIPAPTYTAGDISTTLASKISVDKSKVVLSASCTFTSISLPPETVNLNPNSTVLTDNGSDVLRLGDSQTGTQGNTLLVGSGQTKLRSA